MKRIIQKYQEGGVVKPGVATGLPAGGNAADAIQSYLSGYVSGPLSYTGVRKSYVPDYRELAKKRKEIRDKTTNTTTTGTNPTVINETEADVFDVHGTGYTDSDVYYSTDSFGTQVPYTIVEPTDVRPPGYVDNTPSNFPEVRDYYDSSPRGTGGPAVSYSSDGTSTDLGFTLGPAVLGGRGTYVPSKATPSPGGWNPHTSTYVNNYSSDPAFVTNADGISGGRTGHATDNDSPEKEARLAALAAERNAAYNLANPVAPSAPKSYLVYNNDERWDIMLNGVKVGEDSNADDARERQAKIDSNSLLNYNNGLNNGGPISLNPSRVQKYNNGSTGGVAIANSRLSEEEIRQRQLMQSPLPQAQASPLSAIGSKLAMSAIDKGIGSAASSMAAKEGLMGTLGNALGGSAATGAATGAAGAGLMAALGPIGIGLGLGKLFGVFNDGGKVPCSCGKTTSCKCAKEIKSPLSGE